MAPLELLLTILGLGVLSSFLVLGLIHGCRRMQDTGMMGVLSDQSGIEAREVTVQGAVRGVFDLQDDYTERPSTGEYRF